MVTLADTKPLRGRIGSRISRAQVAGFVALLLEANAAAIEREDRVTELRESLRTLAAGGRSVHVPERIAINRNEYKPLAFDAIRGHCLSIIDTEGERGACNLDTLANGLHLEFPWLHIPSEMIDHESWIQSDYERMEAEGALGWEPERDEPEDDDLSFDTEAFDRQDAREQAARNLRARASRIGGGAYLAGIRERYGDRGPRAALAESSVRLKRKRGLSRRE